MALSITLLYIIALVALVIVVLRFASRLAFWSVVCSAGGFILLWLVVPLLVLPPIGLVLGFRSYRQFKQANSTGSVLQLLFELVPMAFAAAVFVFGFYLLNTQYNP
jgi:hypothetical protein